jgi:hypothetical protein
VTMKNSVFLDIKSQFIPLRKHITSPLHSPAGQCYVRSLKNVIFWHIKAQFVPHMRDSTSPLLSPAAYCYVRFRVFTVVTMKNTIFWDVTPCGSC